MTATGSVYLINPQGIIIGPRSVITTGGRFLASSLDTGNTAFMSNGSLTFSGPGTGYVVNLGSISSAGGDVFLVSRKFVANSGMIKAAKGTAELDVGSSVLLKDSSTGQQVFVDAGSHGTVLNAGSIRAAQISLQAADGNIYALAGRNNALRATGTATRGAQVWLVANNGAVDAHGNIDAHDIGGSGGTVDIRARSLNVKGDVVQAAQWNLTSPTLTINAGTGQALARSLDAGTSVTAGTTGHGNIAVDASVRWNGNASLSFNVGGNVVVAHPVKLANVGGGDLTLRADAAGADIGSSVINYGTIDWSHSTGVVNALYDMTGSYVPGTIKTNGSWTASAFSGLQTQVTAYKLVNTVADLENVSQDLAGNYALGKDIDASTATSSFVPIGDAALQDFTGQFDGKGHTISGLTMWPANSGASAEGMFYSIGSSGVVRDFNLINAGINAGGGIFTGGAGLLAGINSGLITRVSTAGYVDTEAVGFTPNAGGLVATNYGTIQRSSSSARVGQVGDIGGLVGVNYGTIVQSFSTGFVGAGSHGIAGGLVGRNASTGNITQSYSSGTVNETFDGGGLAYSNAGTISQSYASGSLQIFGGGGAGGIAAFNTGSIASNVFWDVDKTGTVYSLANSLSSNAVGLTTAQMSQASSFGPTWNFSTAGTWTLPAGASAPVLRWQLTPFPRT